MLQGMVENCRFDLTRNSVGMWPPCPRNAVDQAFLVIGLEVAPELVESLS